MLKSTNLMNQDWRNIKFKDFVTLQRGFDLPKTEMIPGPYPVIGSTSIIGYHDEFKVAPPGVVTGRSGSLGFVQYVTSKYFPHNTSLWVKDFKGNNELFVYYKLKTLDLKRFNSGAGVPTLNRNDLDTLDVRIPLPDEQQRIASILSAYDDLIENNTRRIKLLEDMARMIWREWFVKFRFPGCEQAEFVDTPHGRLPDGWEVRKFTDIVDVLSGGTPKTSVPEYWDGDINWFTPADLSSNFYVLETKRKISELGLTKCNSKLYPQNTIFMTARGTVGKCALASVPMAMSQTSYALIGRQNISPLYVFMQAIEMSDSLRKKATGAVFDTIVVDTFRGFDILVPNSVIINSYGRMTSSIFRKILTLQKTNINLHLQRDILLPGLVNGEVEVPDANAQ